MNLFRLDASILPGTSVSAELADLVESEWAAVHPDAPVVRRHLGTDPLPADAWAYAHTGNLTPEPDRTPAQRDTLALAGSLAAELEAAEAVVLAVPLYNFGVSQHFKTWVDPGRLGPRPGACAGAPKAMDDQLIDELVCRAQAEGLQLTGDGGGCCSS
ncbi:NAD(P)H-dependent oxidoreductase [Streptomyces bobili]